MKMRILSAVVGILILFTILFCPLTWVLAVAAAALATIAVWELLHNTGIVPQKGFLYSGMLFAGTEVLAIAYAEYLGWLPFALPALYLLMAVFIAAMPRYGVKSRSVDDLCYVGFCRLGAFAFSYRRLVLCFAPDGDFLDERYRCLFHGNALR